MKILFSTPGNIIGFGPYQDQVYQLINCLIDTEEIHYLAYKDIRTEKIPMLSLTEYNQKTGHQQAEDETKRDLNVLSKIKYHILTDQLGFNISSISAINQVIESQQIDIVIMLGDILEFICDQNFKCWSVMWLPSHYAPLDKANTINLSFFDQIVVLAPSCIPVIKQAFLTLPEDLSGKKIGYIPHIIETNPKLQVSIPKKNVARLCHNYRHPNCQIKSTDYVVTIIAGNYELNYRKSYATSFLAFREFQQQIPEAFLYVQAFTPTEVNKFCSDLTKLASYHGTDLPTGRYYINQTRVDTKTIDQIYYLSDVVMIGSKSEGFGLPILEAQSRGLPVVTSKFLAMNDYTFYGQSAKCCQVEYDHIGNGMWTVPSIKHLTQALLTIYQNPSETNKQSAIARIKKEFSLDFVLTQFKELIYDNHNIRQLKATYTECFLIDGQDAKNSQLESMIGQISTLSPHGAVILLLPQSKSVEINQNYPVLQTSWTGLEKALTTIITSHIYYLSVGTTILPKFCLDVVQNQPCKFYFILTRQPTSKGDTVFPQKTIDITDLLSPPNLSLINIAINCYLFRYLLGRKKMHQKIDIIIEVMQLKMPMTVTADVLLEYQSENNS